MGPLFHWGDSAEDEALTEAELYPPHSRFHPVPTAPVFAQRLEYSPPESMMETVPDHRFPHLAPQLNAVPTQSVPPRTSPVQTEPGSLFIPGAEAPAEAIPLGPAVGNHDSHDADIRDYESEGRRPGGVRLLRR